MRQRILADARAGRLPAGVVTSNLIACVTGRVGPPPAPPEPPTPEQVGAEARSRRMVAYFESLSPAERRIAADLARVRAGLPTYRTTTAEDNRRIEAAQAAARRDAPPA